MNRAFQITAIAVLAILASSCAGNGNNGSSSSESAVENTSAVNNGCSGVLVAASASEYMHDIRVLSDFTDGNGVRTVSVEPSDVCSVRIDVTVKDGTILDVTFTGGCPGNTTGVSKLVAGMKVTDAIKKLEGIDCGGKGTSCPDQLSKALKLFL